MNRRVLCCSGSLDGGGSERQLWQLASGLAPHRFASEIFLIYRRGHYLDLLPPHIPVHAFWSEHAPGRMYWPGRIRQRQIGYLVRLIRERHINVVYDRTFHMTLLTSVACRRTRTPRISVIVSPPSQDFVRSRERFRWFKQRLLAQAYRDPLCQPVVVSQSVADDAAKFYGVARERFLTLPSPIDVAAVRQAAAAPPLPLTPTRTTGASGDASQVFQVCVVGRLSAEKGQATALQAVAQLRTRRPQQLVALRIIGDGPQRAQLEQLARQLGIESCTHFTGQLDNPYPAIREADLLCIPSLYEGLPNVALEAMCLETPLLATDCSGSVRELIGADERGRIVPVQNAQLLAEAMLDRLDAPQIWQQRAARAATWVNRRHGLQPWLEDMQQLLERLAPKEISCDGSQPEQS